MKNRLSGFSLIELLVVISIIVLLTTIAVSSYGNFQKNSRDVKRQADLKIIQSALEQYHADQGYYASTSAMADASTKILKYDQPINMGSKIYLKSLPRDPRYSVDINFNYLYEASPSGCDNTSSYCRKYRLCAKLESPPSGSSCSISGANANYEVAPQL